MQRLINTRLSEGGKTGRLELDGPRGLDTGHTDEQAGTVAAQWTSSEPIVPTGSGSQATCRAGRCGETSRLWIVSTSGAIFRAPFRLPLSKVWIIFHRPCLRTHASWHVHHRKVGNLSPLCGTAAQQFHLGMTTGSWPWTTTYSRPPTKPTNRRFAYLLALCNCHPAKRYFDALK